MPESLSNLLVHIIFSTKERRPFLRDPAQRVEMHRYVAGISERLHCPAILIGGAEDHVHLFASQSRTISLADRATKHSNSGGVEGARPRGRCPPLTPIDPTPPR